MKQLKSLVKIKENLLKIDFQIGNMSMKEWKKWKSIITFDKNAVENDVIIFQQATFSGSFKKPKFSGYNTRICKVIRENYRKDLQHQFFLFDLEKKIEFSIMGRNLYGNNFVRVLGNEAEEQQHQENTIEKNERGEWCWEERQQRKLQFN